MTVIIVLIGIVLFLITLLCLLFSLPYWGINKQFEGRKEDELEERIKDAEPSTLWCDGHLVTTMRFTLRNDVHEMRLMYKRKHYNGVTYTGGFRISDERNTKNVPINGFGVFNFLPNTWHFRVCNQLLLPSKAEKLKLLPIRTSNS